jgi:pectate lyase
MTNPSNCGACGTACAAGQTCSSGTCMGGTTTSGVIGWAAVSGNGVTTTTGGSGGTTIDVSSASALSSAASSSTRQIIRLTASVSVSSLVIGSNKTILGVGPNIVISGGIEINNQNNVILQNFRLNGASSGVSAGDGIRITNSHHVWIDHLEVYDALDGNLDITDRSNFITVSWTKFRYSTNSGDHRYSNLIGAGDNETGDEALLNVTWHHNWWAQNVHERMPRVRFGDVHVFNNYYSSSGNNYCIRAGFHSNVLIENNHFQGVGKPHEIGEDSGTAIVTARGNTYSSTSGAQTTRGTAFTPPYPYTLDAVGTISAAVQSGAGPH